MKNKNLHKTTIISLTIALSILCLIMASCSGGNDSSNLPPIKDLEVALPQADKTLPEMLTIDSDKEDAEELFSYLSIVDYEKVDGFFLTYSAEGLADEIAVIRMKDKADVKEMEESIKEHVEGRVSLYESYNPEQVTRAENAIIFSNDKDVVLIISDNGEDVSAAYNAACEK